MVVVDTTVVAGLFIDGPFSKAARELYALDADWRSESFAMVEFTNVLRVQVRAGRLAADAAPLLVERALSLFGDGLRDCDHAQVLATAMRHGTSAYDARFLSAAQSWNAVLVTEDAALRRRAPTLTRSIAEALAA